MVTNFSRFNRPQNGSDTQQPRFADGKPYLVMLFTGIGYVVRPMTADGRRAGIDVSVGGWEHAKAVLAASTQKRGWIYQGHSKYSDHTLDGIGRCLVSHDVFAGIADELDSRPIGVGEDESGPFVDLEAAVDALIHSKTEPPKTEAESAQTDQLGRLSRSSQPVAKGG